MEHEARPVAHDEAREGRSVRAKIHRMHTLGNNVANANAKMKSGTSDARIMGGSSSTTWPSMQVIDLVFPVLQATNLMPSAAGTLGFVHVLVGKRTTVSCSRTRLSRAMLTHLRRMSMTHCYSTRCVNLSVGKQFVRSHAVGELDGCRQVYHDAEWLVRTKLVIYERVVKAQGALQ